MKKKKKNWLCGDIDNVFFFFFSVLFLFLFGFVFVFSEQNKNTFTWKYHTFTELCMFPWNMLNSKMAAVTIAMVVNSNYKATYFNLSTSGACIKVVCQLKSGKLEKKYVIGREFP